jgi:DNA-binding GntR family transcriptional regulator
MEAVNGQETSTRREETLSDAIYSLIRSGELSPGQKVDQRAVSARLSVSRTPLREALRALAADGVLAYVAHQGYVVAKHNVHDLRQYYALREYLETALLTSMVWPDHFQLEDLRSAEQACVEASDTRNIGLAARCNRDFHFLMFSWSPLTIMRSEAERVWRVSEAYRMMHLADADRHAELLDDHARMVRAIERHDLTDLLELMSRHRQRTCATIGSMAAPNGVVRPVLSSSGC